MNTGNTTVAALLVILATVSGGAGVASADEQNTSTTPENTTQTPPATTQDASTPNQATESSSKDCVEVVQKTGNTTTKQCVPEFNREINNATTILAVDWGGDTATIVIHSDTVQQATVSDALKSEASSKQFVMVPARNVVLEPGRNVVRIPVTELEGDKAVSIGTTTGSDYYATISNPEEPFLENGVRAELLYVGGAGGATSVFVFAFLFWAYKRWKLNNDWTNVFEDYSP